jgi:hypothetical protein
MSRFSVDIVANSVPATDFQRLADKLYAVMASEANSIKVEVKATVERPTLVTFQPNRSHDAYAPYADAINNADLESGRR